MFSLAAPLSVHAQRGPAPQAPEDGAYGTRFFEQLHVIFGKFRDAELQRAFQMAEPIRCSDLVSGKGEWRSVAFFNEDRRLGDYYRETLEEVKSDPEAYIFEGLCTGDRGALRLRTKYPVRESIDAYNAGRIRANEIVISVNAPVSAVFDPRSQTYSFDLPYLYLINRAQNRYSLVPTRLSDRGKYAPEVTNHWDCKAVKAADVTYRFMVCQTFTRPKDSTMKSNSFGSSAYVILSDGTEASSSVTLTFGDLTDAAAPPVSERNTPTLPEPEKERLPDIAVSEAPLPGNWTLPAATSKVMDTKDGEFRVLFSIQTWIGKIGSPGILLDQKISSAETKPKEGSDYCTWRPGSTTLIDRLLAKEPETGVEYSVNGLDSEGKSPASLVFTMKTFTGLRLGELQCFFPRATAAASIDFDRWVSIVGAHLTLEVVR